MQRAITPGLQGVDDDATLAQELQGHDQAWRLAPGPDMKRFHLGRGARQLGVNVRRLAVSSPACQGNDLRRFAGLPRFQEKVRAQAYPVTILNVFTNQRPA